jgi:hypothetical protein
MAAPASTPTSPEPDPASVLRAATNNFLVIWSIFRTQPTNPTPTSLRAIALRKADRALHSAYLGIRAPHLRNDPALQTQYAAVDDFFMTWSVLGPLALQDSRPYAPLLDSARLKLQAAFELESEPSRLL